MQVKLSSYALVGVEAVPPDVFVDGDRARVVEPENSHYHSWLSRVRPREQRGDQCDQ